MSSCFRVPVGIPAGQAAEAILSSSSLLSAMMTPTLAPSCTNVIAAILLLW